MLPKLPKSIEEAMKADEVMVAPLIRTTISDDRGDEPCYDGYPASELINKGYEIPHVIGLLWDKRLISKQEAEIIKRIMMLSADHGPCVSGAYATILAACAGIGLSQSVAAGLIMIGPRFGGAVTDAGRWFKYAVDNKMSVDEFLAYMKKNVGPVPGIGHRVKSLRNPDKRVKELVGYVKSLNIKTPCLDFALASGAGDRGEERQPDSERGRDDGGGAGRYRVPGRQFERLLHPVTHDRIDRPLGRSEASG